MPGLEASFEAFIDDELRTCSELSRLLHISPGMRYQSDEPSVQALIKDPTDFTRDGLEPFCDFVTEMTQERHVPVGRLMLVDLSLPEVTRARMLGVAPIAKAGEECRVIALRPWLTQALSDACGLTKPVAEVTRGWETGVPGGGRWVAFDDNEEILVERNMTYVAEDNGKHRLVSQVIHGQDITPGEIVYADFWDRLYAAEAMPLNEALELPPSSYAAKLP
jgi:hypothetical protein